ncbi:hypothetical protein F4703DRAFT_1855592 [Phycomyces blakesleeanus]
MDVNRILQYVSETIEKLSLTGFIYNGDHQNTTLGLSYYCPVLTELCIKGENVSLDLDKILEKCVALKKLKFAGERLFVDTNTISEDPKQQHGLQELMLYDCAVKAEVFHYISFKYRSLKKMLLKKVFIEGSICYATGCLLLDMPYTFLEYLYISEIQFGESYEDMDLELDIALTRVSQISEPQMFNERNKKEETEIDSIQPIVESYDLEWFYTHVYNLADGTSPAYSVEISKENVKIIHEYFKNFPLNSRNLSLYEDEMHLEEEPENWWKFELYKGYGEFRFGKIKHTFVWGGSEDEF